MLVLVKAKHLLSQTTTSKVLECSCSDELLDTMLQYFPKYAYELLWYLPENNKPRFTHFENIEFERTRILR